MGLLQVSSVLIFSASIVFLFFVFLRVLFSFWILPALAYQKIKRSGFKGPTPSFPFGNLSEMMKNKSKDSPVESLSISHDIHSTVFPYFARWQQSHGKVFFYWLGTEPFLYVAEPEFLKRMSTGILGKSWGKPNVFKYDRKPLFGKGGLLMVEGEDWVRHRHAITPAFSPSYLKVMSSSMVESTSKMLDRWSSLINSGNPVIDVEREISSTAGEIIAKASFGLSYENGRKVIEKLRAMHLILFESNRYVGVPFSKVMNPKKSLKARKLESEIDSLLLSIITDRKKSGKRYPSKDLLGILLEENEVDGRRGKTLTTGEVVDECKTFFFAGHETTALAVTWTLLLLAMYPAWQNQLREEIREVMADKEFDFQMLAGLKKMGWVMNEVLRLYSPGPNAQRQVREDIKVDDQTIPKGTNMWIDIVSLHHDPALWGDDVFEFKPERFRDDQLYGGCKHKMGFLPFGFGGRMCIGRNLTKMEYKVVLTLLLSRFSFQLSPTYCHSPSTLLSLRPTYGLPLIVQPL